MYNDFLKLPLKSYQEEGVNFLSARQFALLGDDLGVGKSIQTIVTALVLRQQNKIKECLIICPASLKYQWQKEIGKFTNEANIIIEGNKTKREQQYFSDTFFKIVNYEIVLRDFELLRKKVWGMVALDEATRIKSFSAKTSKAVKLIPRTYRYALTGIPIEKSPDDLYSLMQFLHPFYFQSNYYAFRGHYMILKKMTFGKKSFMQIVGYKNLDELNLKLKPVMLRRTKAEVATDLPERIDRNVYVELTHEQRQIYEQIKNMIKSDIINNRSFLDKILYLRRLCDDVRVLEATANNDIAKLIPNTSVASAKLKELQHIIEGTAEEKFVIFTEWTSSQRIINSFLIEVLKDRYKIFIVNGNNTAREKHAILEDFEQTKNAVLVSTNCLQMGTNLQTASVLINFDLPYSWAAKEQRIGRVHRTGQQGNMVNVFNLICKNTIEEHVEKIIASKKELFDAIIVRNPAEIATFI